jgi:WD40 repeat protein
MHVVAQDSEQFASQMVGRLLTHCDKADVAKFANALTAAAPRPWLRPLHAALHPPGTTLLRTLAGHSDPVLGVAVSGDGQRAVSASRDKTLKVWDLETGAVVATFSCDGSARCCAFAGAGKIVAGDAGGRVHFLALEL